MRAERFVERECRRRCDGQSPKTAGDGRRHVQRPAARLTTPTNRLGPETQAPLLSNVNLLATTYQADDHRPIARPLGELDEMLRFRARVGKGMFVRIGHLSAVERSLRLIENHDMFRRLQVPATVVSAHVFANGSHERAPGAASLTQYVLENLHPEDRCPKETRRARHDLLASRDPDPDRARFSFQPASSRPLEPPPTVRGDVYG